MEASEVWKALASHGILGVLCAIFMWAYWNERKERNRLASRQAEEAREFQRQAQEMQREYLDKREEHEARHRAELTALMERHANKAETWMEKHRELAVSQQALLDAALTRR